MNKKEKGFTLIELMMAIAIIGILAAIAIPNYNTFVLRAKRTEAQSNLLQLQTLLEQHYQDFRSYAHSNAPAADINVSTTAADIGAITVSTLLPGWNPGPAANQRFTYNITTSNNGQNFVLSAAGLAAKGTDTLSFAMNDANVRCWRDGSPALVLGAAARTCPAGSSAW